MISAGTSHIPVCDDVGINYIFNGAKNELVTSFYGWGWKDFLRNSNSLTGVFILFQMTNNSDAPIKVAPCNSKTMSQIRKVQVDTSSDNSSHIVNQLTKIQMKVI
jgi:hypothetical protein